MNQLEIVYETRNLLNSIRIHDSEFVGYSYDYDKRMIFFACRNLLENKVMNFSFHNVILHHLQSCSFWHGGNAILWVNNCDWDNYRDELMEQAVKYKNSYLDQGIQYLAVEFIINSGDSVLIVCERMVYTENELP